ncbi:MAG: PfaD family polyunsaturated fatty acid/polyketide biosynthesis protein [Desulfuromonas sp.]|nr:PfaD family polyunsaturated fatty acid/polyketide biosynthesis protein [Desulfuromonas sp.]
MNMLTQNIVPQVSNANIIGSWSKDGAQTAVQPSLYEALHHIKWPLYLTADKDRAAIYTSGVAQLGQQADINTTSKLLGYVPPLTLSSAGDHNFLSSHRLRYPIVAGSMAKGISSAQMVVAMGQAGMLGFLGAAGQTLETVQQQLDIIKQALPDGPYGVNLIHSPQEVALEEALVDLYIANDIKLIEASAFLTLSPAVVRYRLHGIHRDSSGNIVTPNKIIAKISREEVAQHFLSPAPAKILKVLLDQGVITPEQATLAEQVPMAEDITAEADSGGHTDNRPALSLFPTICSLRDRLHQQYNYAVKPRIGLAGGISTPQAAAAAFAMGAAYLVTGSVNQACIESGTSDVVRQMLAETRQADVAMAPAADMFEMGVDVQVLKRGTMFSMRAKKLYEIYRQYSSIDDIPALERQKIEQNFFREPLVKVWEDTRNYFLQRDPKQVERADRDPKHLMALVFRAYLGQATYWANAGDNSRKMDFQVWCGPAMGAFNEWAHGSFLETPQQRSVVSVNLNILFNALVLTRINMLRQQGGDISIDKNFLNPLTIEQIKEYLRD